MSHFHNDVEMFFCNLLTFARYSGSGIIIFRKSYWFLFVSKFFSFQNLKTKLKNRFPSEYPARPS